MTETQLIATYGANLVLLGLFAYRDVWPIVRDWLRPEAAAARRKAADARRQAELDRESRLFRAFEQNTAAMVGLQLTLTHVSAEIQALAAGQRELMDQQQDHGSQLAEIYGYLQKPRPQRRRSNGGEA